MNNILSHLFQTFLDSSDSTCFSQDALSDITSYLSFQGVMHEFLYVDDYLCVTFFNRLIDLLPVSNLSDKIDFISIISNLSYFNKEKPVKANYDILKIYAIESKDISIFLDIVDILENINICFSKEEICKICSDTEKSKYFKFC